MPPPLTLITQVRVALNSGVLQIKRGESDWEDICSIEDLELSNYKAVVETNSGGAFSIEFPEGLFNSSPIVLAVVEAAGGREHVVTLTAVSETGCTGVVRRSRALPAVLILLSALVGYDPWEAPGVVNVHVYARA